MRQSVLVWRGYSMRRSLPLWYCVEVGVGVANM